MLYINQREHEDILYLTNLNEPESEIAVKGTIKSSGCGICSACMVVDRLCMDTLSMEDCIKLSYDHKANLEPGTDMQALGPALAEKFHLKYQETDETEVLNDWLQKGGCAIVNVGGNRKGHKGVFSSVGHFMVLLSFADGEYQILDPDWTKEKFENAPVRMDGKMLYATEEVILGDTANRSPAFYLFR